MNNSISITTVNICAICKRPITPNMVHVCCTSGSDNTDTPIYHGPIFMGTQHDQIIQRLDKIIELLEILPEKEENNLLVKMSKLGIFEQLIKEAELISLNSDWEKELDEI